MVSALIDSDLETLTDNAGLHEVSRYFATYNLVNAPVLDAEQWSTVRDVIEDRGWWSCAFLTVPMAGGRGDVTPLCLLP